MHARSTTILGDPGSMDEAIAFIRDEVMPMATGLEGCLGLSLVVDREAGRAIATSSWRDEGSMHDSDEQMVPLRQRGQEILGGSVQVEEWEVAAMHRDHASPEGSCCRVTWARPQDVDAMVDGWVHGLLPRIEQMEGFCSASLLVDRPGGRLCGTVTFDSHDALAATREEGARMREGAMETYRAELLEVAEMDLEIAHLRLPELV